jgi:hypothetical protein
MTPSCRHNPGLGRPRGAAKRPGLTVRRPAARSTGLPETTAGTLILGVLPAAGGPASLRFGSHRAGSAQAPGCVPVPAAECGSVRVPLFRSRPAGPKIDVAYVLVRAFTSRNSSTNFAHGL